MYQLVINSNDTEKAIFVAEDRRLVELLRQRHARSLSEGEAIIRDFKPQKEKK